MEREGKAKKDYWDRSDEDYEAHCEKIQERFPDRATKGGAGTKDGVDASRERK